MKRTQDIHEALPLHSKAFSLKAETNLNPLNLFLQS